MTAGATSTSASLDAATAEVTGLTASVAAMPAGDTREKYERKLRCAAERQTQLTDRQTSMAWRSPTAVRQAPPHCRPHRSHYLAELAAHRAGLPA